MLWGGIVAPGAIGVLVLVSLAMWRVHWPAGFTTKGVKAAKTDRGTPKTRQ